MSLTDGHASSSNGSTPLPLDAASAKTFLDSIDALCLDCDGVLWEGARAFEGIPETLTWLRGLGKKLLFVTNNSRTSRREYKKKMALLGIDAEVVGLLLIEQVVSSVN